MWSYGVPDPRPPSTPYDGEERVTVRSKSDQEDKTTTTPDSKQTTNLSSSKEKAS